MSNDFIQYAEELTKKKKKPKHTKILPELELENIMK